VKINTDFKRQLFGDIECIKKHYRVTLEIDDNEYPLENCDQWLFNALLDTRKNERLALNFQVFNSIQSAILLDVITP
jgi:hypothetical protein